MKHLEAIKEVWYDGRKREAGDRFMAHDIDATILTAHDVSGGARAKLVTAPMPAPPPPEAPPPPIVEPPPVQQPPSEIAPPQEPQADLQAPEQPPAEDQTVAEEAPARRRYYPRKRDQASET